MNIEKKETLNVSLINNKTKDKVTVVDRMHLKP